MLKVLLRSRMEALLSVLTGAGRTKKAQSKGKLIGFATLMLLSLFSLGTLFARIFEVLAQPLAMLDMGWLYFGMAVVMMRPPSSSSPRRMLKPDAMSPSFLKSLSYSSSRVPAGQLST